MRAPLLPCVIALAAGLAVAWPLSRRAITAREDSGAERAAVSPDATPATDAMPPLPPALTLEALLALPRREFWQPFAVWLAQADAGQLAAFAEAAPGQWWEREWTVWRGLFARWTALDLPASRAFYEDHLPGTEAGTFDFAFLAGWVEHDRDAALAAAWQRQLVLDATATSQDEIDWTRSFEAVATVAAEADPVGFLEWHRTLLPGRRQGACSQGAGVAMARLMAADPTLARAEMERQFSAGNDLSFDARVMSGDPAGLKRALSLLDELPLGPQRQNAVHSLAEGLHGASAALFGDWLERQPPSYNRIKNVESLARSWSFSDPEAALAWVRRLSGKEREIGLRSICRSLSSEPERMVAIVDELGWHRLKGGDLDIVFGYMGSEEDIAAALRRWGDTHPAAALERAAGVFDGPIMAKPAAAWIERDPAAAEAWIIDAAGRGGPLASAMAAFWPSLCARPELLAKVLDASPDEVRGAFFQSVRWGYTREVGPGSVEKVAAVVAALSRPLSALDLRQAFDSLVTTLPLEAAEWIERFPGGDSDEVLAQRRSAFLEACPRDELGAWLSAHPTTFLEASNLPELAGRAAELDFAGATAWLAALPADDRRDVVIDSVVRTIEKDGEPVDLAREALLQWSLAAQDPARREALATLVLRRWTEKSAASAEEALRRTGLPVDTQQALLERARAAQLEEGQ